MNGIPLLPSLLCIIAVAIAAVIIFVVAWNCMSTPKEKSPTSSKEMRETAKAIKRARKEEAKKKKQMWSQV